MNSHSKSALRGAGAGGSRLVEEIIQPDLEICDPHHHLWDLPAIRYLLPELLTDAESGHTIQSTVFVECGSFYRADGADELRFVGETEFANGIAAMAASGRYGSTLACEGIVGRADLTTGARVESLLEHHISAGNGRFRAIRHGAAYHASPKIRSSHTNPPPNLYGQPQFREGFSRLARFDLTFESWQYHTQLRELLALARAFPDTPIMVDHVGGPLGIGPFAGRRNEVFAAWRKDVQEIGREPNVWVKLGGLGMATCGFDFHKRDNRPGSIELAQAWRPYVETCIEAFGSERAMFESNFPVDRISCDYPVLWNAMKRIAEGASDTEKAALFRENARRFYRLGPPRADTMASGSLS